MSKIGDKDVVSGELDSMLNGYTLLDSLRNRRSRRFAMGMKTEVGPLAYTSQHSPCPLSEREEAALVYAACGITGYALGDLVYAKGEGGTMMGGMIGRTVPSPDAVCAVSLMVSNDQATYLIKRPQDFAPEELPELIELGQRGAVTELYRRSRVKIKDGRATIPVEPITNIDVNRWDLFASGTTTFVPVVDVTYLYINALLEFFNESMAVFPVDERKGFRPAGVKRYMQSKGGHLNDDPKSGHTATIERLEATLQLVLTVEMGAMIQNLGLMTQAMGLGGFPFYSAHEFAWPEALGFKMREVPILKYLGASRMIQIVGGWMGKNQPYKLPMGLEVDGEVLLKPYCPPYYDSMEDAVRAVVEKKFGPKGLFGGDLQQSGWQDPASVAQSAPPVSEATIGAVSAYCSYIHKHYGRFPAYPPPYRTVNAFQVSHLDLDFFDTFYRPEMLSDTQRQHMKHWHGDDKK